MHGQHEAKNFAEVLPTRVIPVNARIGQLCWPAFALSLFKLAKHALLQTLDEGRWLACKHVVVDALSASCNIGPAVHLPNLLMRQYRVVFASLNPLDPIVERPDEICRTGRSESASPNSATREPMAFTLGIRFREGDHPIWQDLWHSPDTRTDDEQATTGRFEDADTERFCQRGIQEDMTLDEKLRDGISF